MKAIKMDKYTQKTKIWVNKRFRKCDEQGIYYAHQPIYGFQKNHSEPRLLGKYIRTFQIMKAFSHLRFDSLLDVGAAEGYKVYLAKKLFNVKVKGCELSEEACQRAKEIFNIESIAADIHNLPFKDNEFDVVLCSETLEHVTDIAKAVEELLRVARKAIVITVPHDSKKTVEQNIKQGAFSHIHSFDLKSFNFLKRAGYNVFSRKMVSPLLYKIPLALIAAKTKKHCKNMKYPKICVDIYNVCVLILRKLFGKRTMIFLIQLDKWLCRFTFFYEGELFIILKNRQYYTKKESINVSADQIVGFAVPYHYLKKKSSSIFKRA